MAKRDELNDLAMQVAMLRQQNMTVKNIALFMGFPEIKIWRLLARSRKLFALMVDANDFKIRMGKNLSLFEAMERKALENLARVDPNSSVAVAYLNAARDAREKIKKAEQEYGLTEKVPQKVEFSGLPLKSDKVRDAAYTLLELAGQEGEKNAGPDNL
jgi:hypothetical protein